MNTKINNWIEQNKLFGLDYSTAKAIVGDYRFDIRYDADKIDSSIKPDNNCRLWLTIYYKECRLTSKSGSSLEELKSKAEIWLRQEIVSYYRKNCALYTEEELKGIVIEIPKKENEPCPQCGARGLESHEFGCTHS